LCEQFLPRVATCHNEENPCPTNEWIHYTPTVHKSSRSVLPITVVMMSFFERNGDRLQCEIRPSSLSGGFDLEVTTTDGERQLEHAADANVLALRWFELEERLKRDGWIKSDV